MSPSPNETAIVTFDDLSLTKIEALERQIATLTLDETATEGALASAKAAFSNLEVRLDSVRDHATGTAARLADARNASTSVLGAIRTSRNAGTAATTILGSVGQLLVSAHEAADMAVEVASAVDELVSEVQTYGKGHVLPGPLVEGVANADKAAKTFLAAAIESVEAVMSAYLEASNAQASAESLEQQGLGLWKQLDAASDPLTLTGLSRLKIGSKYNGGVEMLAQALNNAGYPAGLLHVLADSNVVSQRDLDEVEAAVNQARIEINLLEQRLANQKSALRAAQLALDGARIALGTRL